MQIRPEAVFSVSKILKAIKVLILTDKQRLLAMEPIGPEMPGWYALLLYRNIPPRHMWLFVGADSVNLK